ELEPVVDPAVREPPQPVCCERDDLGVGAADLDRADVGGGPLGDAQGEEMAERRVPREALEFGALVRVGRAPELSVLGLHSFHRSHRSFSLMERVSISLAYEHMFPDGSDGTGGLTRSLVSGADGRGPVLPRPAIST